MQIFSVKFYQHNYICFSCQWMYFKRRENRNLFRTGWKLEWLNKKWLTFSFSSTTAVTYYVTQSEVGSDEFVQGVNFENIDPLKRNCAKCPVNFKRFKWINLEKRCQYKNNCQIWSSNRHIFVLPTYKTFKLLITIFARSREWSFPVIYCPTTAW